MFYKGVLHSYDPARQAGIIKINNHDFDVHFVLNDMANTSVELQMGERVKCIVVDRDEKHQAKFIVRLDNKNSRVEQPLNQLFYRSNEEVSGQTQTFDREVDELIEKKNFKKIASEVTQSEKSVAEFELDFNSLSKEAVILEGSNIETESVESQPEVKKIILGEPIEEVNHIELSSNEQQNSAEQTLNEHIGDSVKELGKVEENEKSKTAQHVESEYGASPKKDQVKSVQKEQPEIKTYFQLKFNAPKMISPSLVNESLKNKKTKKRIVKDYDQQFNPWIFASIVPILLIINLAMWGFQKYQEHQNEQTNKVNIYSIQQDAIIQQQKKQAEK